MARAYLPGWLYWFCPATLSQYDNFHRYTFATGDPILANGIWIKDAACLLWIGIAALSLALILFHARRHRAYAKRRKGRHMLRLIKSELRKLFLSPLSLIVIVLLIGYYGYSAYDVCVNRIAPYELHPLPSLGLSFETAEGEPLDSKPAVNRYVHSVLSRYQGTADMTLWQQYMEDYNKCYRRLTKDIDEQSVNKNA